MTIYTSPAGERRIRRWRQDRLAAWPPPHLRRWRQDRLAAWPPPHQVHTLRTEPGSASGGR